MSDLLQIYLHSRDVPCPNCAYNLRNLTNDACPECGLQVVLSVHLAEPKLAAFVTGLVGLAMGLGFSGLLTLFALLFAGLNHEDIERWGWAMMACAAVTAPMVPLWVRLRPRLRRTSGLVRRTATLLCWLVTAAVLVVFVFSIDY